MALERARKLIAVQVRDEAFIKVPGILIIASSLNVGGGYNRKFLRVLLYEVSYENGQPGWR